MRSSRRFQLRGRGLEAGIGFVVMSDRAREYGLPQTNSTHYRATWLRTITNRENRVNRLIDSALGLQTEIVNDLRAVTTIRNSWIENGSDEVSRHWRRWLYWYACQHVVAGTRRR